MSVAPVARAPLFVPHVSTPTAGRLGQRCDKGGGCAAKGKRGAGMQGREAIPTPTQSGDYQGAEGITSRSVYVWGLKLYATFLWQYQHFTDDYGCPTSPGHATWHICTPSSTPRSFAPTQSDVIFPCCLHLSTSHQRVIHPPAPSKQILYGDISQVSKACGHGRFVVCRFHCCNWVFGGAWYPAAGVDT